VSPLRCWARVGRRRERGGVDKGLIRRGRVGERERDRGREREREKQTHRKTDGMISDEETDTMNGDRERQIVTTWYISPVVLSLTRTL
jgi:hypothetical protein